MSRSKTSETVWKRQLVELQEQIEIRAYVVTREEECCRRGRLSGLHWDTGDCARGRDWNLRFLLSLKNGLS